MIDSVRNGTYFALIALSTVLNTVSEKYIVQSRVSLLLALMMIIYFDDMAWATWYWLVTFVPIIFRPFFRKQSSVRERSLVVLNTDNDDKPYERSWTDPMLTTNIAYLVMAGIVYYYGQVHFAFINLLMFWGSCIYHAERETQWYNFDCSFAQFGGHLLIWVMYCAAPTPSTYFERIDTFVNFDGIAEYIEDLMVNLEPFIDDRGFMSHLSEEPYSDLNVCEKSEEFFWVMLFGVPIGMFMLEAGGENAFIKAATDKVTKTTSSRGNSSSSTRRGSRSKYEQGGTSEGVVGEDTKVPLTTIKSSLFSSFTGALGGACYCTRETNPRYELYHPMWHVLSIAGPLLCLTYFNTHCTTPIYNAATGDLMPHVLGSIKVVSIKWLPFLEALQLPVVPSFIMCISFLNSLQLNMTGIKPPE
jgi:hypothetical protein